MLPDYLAPGLDIVFVGINPGVYSDRAGHYFARKQNQFWSALYEAGLTSVRLPPQDDHRMLECGYGLTDIVKRPTANASFVADAEFVEGVRLLEASLTPLAPCIICFVGLVGYRRGLDRRAVLGPQPVRWGRSHLFVVPSTSPRNARYRGEITAWFRRLKKYRDRLRLEK